MALENATITITTVINSSAEGGGGYTTTITKTGDGLERASHTVPAAKPGVLTTRTDNNTGTFTMTAGHGFITNDVCDIFWSGGSRRGMTGTVTVNSIVFDGGSGDNLPAQDTAVTVCKPVSKAFEVDGDAIENLVVGATGIASGKTGWVVFVDDADVEIAPATLEVDATTRPQWCEEIGTTNPLAGKLTTVVKFSHGDTTARVMRAAAIKT